MIPLSQLYAFYFKVLHCQFDQSVSHALTEMDLTAAQGHILGYLAHRKDAPCSRDIEQAFHLSHPTVSGLLVRLQKKDFIEFRPDPSDRRCKRIYMLPRGHACTQMIRRIIQENEAKIVAGFTPEEKELFGTLLQRSISNLGLPSCDPNPKEETT